MMRGETKFNMVVGLVIAVCLSCYLIHSTSSNKSALPLNTPHQTLSAYYQCHANPRAVHEVLKNFRHIYPSSKITMINDGGNPSLKLVAKYYGAQYSYSNQTSSHKHSMFFSSETTASAYVSRILHASTHCDWLLLLEDDVWVLDKIPLHTFHHALNGGHTGMILDDILTKVIQNMTNPALHAPLQYAGNGGTILRCSFFRDIQRMGVWREGVAALLHAKPEIASDELLSSITYLAGGSIGTFKGYMEPKFAWFLYSYLTGDISVLHQAKFLYE